MNPSYVKRADSPPGVARLQREAKILRRAAQPGVVEVLGFRSTPTRAELHLVQIPGRRFDPAESPNLSALVAKMGSLTATVARLHGLGLAHTRLTSDHVLLSSRDGRPVICGFGGAQPVDASVDARSEDVLALGRLLAQGLEANAPVASPDEEALREALEKIAADATSDDPPRRPTAVRMAEALRAAATPMPASTVPRRKPPQAATPKIDSQRERGRITAGLGALRNLSRRALVACTAGVLGLTLLAALVLRPDGGTATDDNWAANLPACPERPGAQLVSDVDADGCGDVIQFSPGAVNVNGERFKVGGQEDVLAIGRWFCEAPRTLALLRPSSGAVFVYDSWPGTGNELRPTKVGTVRGGVSISAKNNPDGCDAIVVTDAAGEATELDPKVAQ